jgi:ribosomal protein L13
MSLCAPASVRWFSAGEMGTSIPVSPTNSLPCADSRAEIAPAKAAETMVLARFSRPVWHLVDARDQTVGRMSSQIVKVLLGKHKPTFNPSTACGDYVVIINAKDAYFTGRKKDDKLYTWHTGYPGGIKQKSVAKTLDDKPEEVGPNHFSVTCTIPLLAHALLFSSQLIRFCGNLFLGCSERTPFAMRFRGGCVYSLEISICMRT